MDRHTHFQEFENLFWHLSRKMEHQWKNIFSKTFPGSQSRIMHLIHQDGPRKMSELANELHLTAGAVTTAANLLIDNGYITRIKNDADRRVVYLDLTEKGRTTLLELRNVGREMIKIVFKDLPDEELIKMCKIFEQASHNIDRL